MRAASSRAAVPLRAPAATLWLLLGMVAAFAYVVVAAQIGSRRLHAQSAEWYAAALLTAGMVFYAGAGCLLLWRRPSNPLGTKLVLTGIALLALGFQMRGLLPVAVLGTLTQSLPYALLIHLLLSFPTGRVTTRWTRALTIAAYITWTVIQAWATYLFDPRFSPDGVLMLADVRWMFLLGDRVLWIVWPLIVLATIGVLVHRIVTSRANGALLWVYGYCVIMLCAVLCGAALNTFGVMGQRTWELWVLAWICGVPVAFVLAMLRGAFAKTAELHELGVWLAEAATDRPSLTAMLAQVLDDPDLRLAYWVAPQNRYVDDGARTVQPRESAMEVTAGGERIGVIDYDPARVTDRGLVAAAASIVALAMQHERLTVELRASRDALRESRTRVVFAADRERARIAQDLHDRMQSRLITLGLAAHRLERKDPDAAALREGLEQAVAELRGIVYGIMPPALLERGLADAVTDLADRQPLPVSVQVPTPLGELPGPLQYTAYAVVNEALSNAIRHGCASAVRIRLSREDEVLIVEIADDGRGGARLGNGLGLPGISDRIDILGGRMTVHSPPGEGTLLRIELPCGTPSDSRENRPGSLVEDAS